MANAVTVVSTRMCERVLMRRLWYQLLPGVRWRSTPAARPHATIDRVIRIDHAGEFGANRIYAGQHAVLRRTDIGQVIQNMWDEEKVHLELFETLMKDRRVRPTVLMPVWNIVGFALGAGTALLGKEAAMACTVAVEEVIGKHYNNQLRELLATKLGDEQLMKGISKCRDDELGHLDTGIEHDAEKTIKAGCRIAIWLSERI